MTQAFRLNTDNDICKQESISFSFDGKNYQGYVGDTLASALLANGVKLVGRSFKYHRPRGILTCGSAEPNALVELRSGTYLEPNTRATMVEIFEGLNATSQNRWPNLRFDLFSINSLFSPLFVAGFYYKTFMWPASFWEPVYERIIRRAAGLGRPSTSPDPDSYETKNLFCDVLIIGAGPSGLMAAETAIAQGFNVVLCDENAWLGGNLAFERFDVEGSRAHEWVKQKENVLARSPKLTILKRTTVFGSYDHNVFGAIERFSDHLPKTKHGQVRQRLWMIRTKKTILATGAQEQPFVFPGNDLPGVMLASAVRAYANRFSVATGKQIVVITNNDDAYLTAFDLHQYGVSIVCIADTRANPGAVSEIAKNKGIKVITNVFPHKAIGKLAVQALELVTSKGESAGTYVCDCIAMSNGFNPISQIAGQSGNKAMWSDKINAFMPPDSISDTQIVGAARGVFDLANCLKDGSNIDISSMKSKIADPSSLVGYGNETPPQWNAIVPNKGKAFVDFQNDVTANDIRLASKEGYLSPEHTKRYTTLWMATDQGKTSQLNGLNVIANAQSKPMSSMQTMTNRPPYSPVAIGSFAAHRREKHFEPIRRTALQAWHERNGAEFMEAGHWLRPKYFLRPGENANDAINRETLAVRQTAGLCDVSTLGKIELFGPDAVTFLNRLYINSYSNLAIGKARYGLMLREDGMVFDDGTVSRLGENHFFITTTTANAPSVMAHLEFYHQCVWPELNVCFCSVTEQWAGMALAGPNARAILAKVVSADVSHEALPFMGVINTDIAGVKARVFRISFSGELAYEINVPWGFGEAVWQKFLDAGTNHGIQPYGLEALNILRIEKGHVTGAEIDGRTTATDLGMERMMSTKKDFIGRMLAQRTGLANTTRSRLVGIKAVDGQRLRAGAHIVESKTDSVNSASELLGNVTSICYSPNLKQWIGLALIINGQDKLGKTVYASFPLKDETVPVEIVSPSFIDPEGKRLQS